MRMDPVMNTFFLVVFLGGIIVLLLMNSVGILNPVAAIIRNAHPAEWSLTEFLRLKENQRRRKEAFLFQEQPVVSIGHRFNGRFDYAVLHWEEAPILDALIERKFPTKILPEKPRSEDMFQAGLYTLALQERGVSCTLSRLVVIYCLQQNAKRCAHTNQTDCFSCSNGAIFTKKFDHHKVLGSLAKLDEVWFRGRKPRAHPTPSKCRACPYGKNRVCKHSAA